MELFGVALLPDNVTRRTFVDFRERHRAYIGGPKLGMDTNLPHMSILQCPYFPDAPYSNALDTIIETVSLRAMKARFASLEYQHVGWAFADVRHDAWMTTLQEACLEATLPFIDTDAIDTDASFLGYTAAEKQNYLTYGYRYVGASFRPHITLGRSLDDTSVTLPLALTEAFRSELSGSELMLNELVFYRAGEFGALAEIIETVTLVS